MGREVAEGTMSGWEGLLYKETGRIIRGGIGSRGRRAQ